MAIRQKRAVILGLALLMAVLFFLFRFDILFSFQAWRLSQLGCGQCERIDQKKIKGRQPGCSKIWVHRADSYERLARLSPYFTGLEADLVFDNQLKNFRVYHPPAPPGNLFADSYFQFLQTHDKKLWLDIKTIDTASVNDAVRVLVNADRRYGLQKKVIIESSQLKFVNALAAHGFAVSYMASPMHLQLNDGVEDSMALQLLPAVQFVSQEDLYTERLKTIFRGKKIITWAIAFKNYFDLSHVRTLLSDTSIAVVLINVKSRDYR